MSILNIKEHTLSNGIKVLYEHIPYVRSVAFKCHVSIGTKNESDSNHGMAHFLEHMLFKGTLTRNSYQIANQIERYGGTFNAYTAKEETAFYFNVVDEYLELAVEVISDMLSNSQMLEKDIEHEKNVVVEEIKGSFDTPDDIIWDYFVENLLKPNSCAKRTLGTIKSVKSFTKEQIVEFWKKNYSSKTITLVAVGNLDEVKFIKMLEKHFSNFKSKQVEEIPFQVVDNQFQKTYKRDIMQSHIVLGKQICRFSNPDRYPLILLNNILGAGMSSRMFQNIREKYGFAYSVYSTMDFQSDHGVFYNYVATDTKHIEQCIDLVKKEVDSFKVGNITDKEIEDAKYQIKGSILLSMENNSRRLDRILRQYLNLGHFVGMDKIIDQFLNIDREELVRVSHEYFNTDAFSSTIITTKKAS